MKRLEILKQYRITVEQEFSSIEKRINECINKLDEMDSLEYVENELSEKEIRSYLERLRHRKKFEDIIQYA